MALLHLLNDWARANSIPLVAATVDHGLRSEAKAEAAAVARICKSLAVPHTTLYWTGWDGSGNLQDQARRARYRLLGNWARSAGIDTIALGHTLEDQAETVLMRLVRGSGVDGLSGMNQSRQSDGLRWVRPLLGVAREDLRQYLRDQAVEWFEDPSNGDPKYDRVKTRQTLAALAKLGLQAEGLVATADRLSLAREALDHLAHAAARQLCQVDRGDVLFEKAGFDLFPVETRLRLFAHALCWVSSAEYRPRFKQLKSALKAVLSGQKRTLHGAVINPEKNGFRVSREYQSVQETHCEPQALWDRRWRIKGPDIKGITVKSLGASGLLNCPEWRQVGLPRNSLMASPALWQNDILMAAPLAGQAKEWDVRLEKGADHFFTSLLTH